LWNRRAKYLIGFGPGGINKIRSRAGSCNNS
jgi:hypothetical protein